MFNGKTIPTTWKKRISEDRRRYISNTLKVLKITIRNDPRTITTWYQPCCPARSRHIDSKSETHEEEEEKGGDQLPQPLPSLNLGIFEDDEAKQEASDGAAHVCDHAVASVNVVIAPVCCVPEVKDKEANDRHHLQYPRQLSPTSQGWFVFAIPTTSLTLRM